MGDSVSVTFSESDMDFNYLVGNDHPRNVKDFHPFVQFAPVLAIQVTLFPNHGISISFVNNHVVGDDATIVPFIRAWASFNKYGGNDQNHEFMIPFYDQSIVKDPYGLRNSIWSGIKEYKTEMSDMIVTPPPPDNVVRGTFIIRPDNIEKLKDLISSRRPSLTHVTSYTVTCGYVWTCLIKLENAMNGTKIIDNTVIEYFSCTVDYRALFDPPLPTSYFGNCIIWYISKIGHVDLIGKEGFTIAAESIGETIHKMNKDKDNVLTGEWLKEADRADIRRFRSFSIVGSPKFDLYPADFGWGGPKKWEHVSLDGGLFMSLIKSKDSNGDLEIRLSLPKTRMNAFASIFHHKIMLH